MIASRRFAPLLLFTGLAVIAAALLIVPWAVQAQSNPTNLSGAIVNGGIVLEWHAPTENAEAAYSYQILRRRPNEGETTLTALVPDTGSTALTYTDDDATEAGRHLRLPSQGHRHPGRRDEPEPKQGRRRGG